MADIPWELFTVILSLLPVESLLRFRSTSKSIRTLIDSHYFINLHLQNSLNFNLILLRNRSNFYRIDFPNLTSSFKANLPIRLYNKGIDLLGSCNGVICISNCINEFAFWNPNTRKHRIIPYLPIPPRSEEYEILQLHTVHGFAFDQLASDYKLVSISLFYHRQDRTCYTQVRLFSSKTNSWRMLPIMPPYKLCSQTPVFVDNCLHWVEFQKPCQIQHYLIVAFNLTREILNEVPLPEIGVAANKHGLIIDVSLLGECLCMTVNYKTMNSQCVWVMKEYGVRDSWCKLFTLGEWHFNAPLTSLKPLGYSSDRSKVLLEVDHKKLFWYDINRGKVTSVLGIPYFNEAMICVESLLPPINNYDHIVRRTNRM